MQVHVRDNNIDQAIRTLKKKSQREGLLREMKLRRCFEKPSEKGPAGRPKHVVVCIKVNGNVLSAKVVNPRIVN